MTKKNIFLIFSFFIFFIKGASAQVKVGSNPTTINPSAVLEVESTNKGFLPPRLTTAQRDAIANPAVGLIIFNTSTNCLNFYVGPNWYEECGVELLPPVSLGSTFTSFSNGSENFSSNTTCQNKLISAGYFSYNCKGNVVVGANSYPVVLINGQCWMQTNLKEAPTSPCAAAINTGCNTWLATSPPTSSADIGSWGYYNTATTNGTAGWATTEPAANEGLLYQWSAAMNGSTSERAQGVCPKGWHIPSDCEWMYLEHGLGMAIAQQTTDNAWRNTTNEGYKLRNFGQIFNNSSGFSALLTGYRMSGGGFANRVAGGISLYWSSTEASANTVRTRFLGFFDAGVARHNTMVKAHALSVRCLKD